MNHGYNKICSLLAAADVSERDIIDFISFAQSVDAEDLLRNIRSYRDYFRNPPSFFADEGYRYSEKESGYYRPETEEKIEHLLLVEAALPKYAAIELMTAELAKYNKHTEIPSEGRKGFAHWIRRLTQIFSESELLHIATRIRNAYVHNENYDWRLK